MLISQAVEKMLAVEGETVRDVAHFMKVYAYARTIAELEGLTAQQRESCELAAVLHDIACPFCRRKYGSDAGNLQEKEGGPLASALLTELGCPEELKNRVAFLVSHHHTTVGVDGSDWQILLEADFLVNAEEGHAPRELIETMRKNVYRTAAGTRFLDKIFLND